MASSSGFLLRKEIRKIGIVDLYLQRKSSWWSWFQHSGAQRSVKGKTLPEARSACFKTETNTTLPEHLNKAHEKELSCFRVFISCGRCPKKQTLSPATVLQNLWAVLQNTPRQRRNQIADLLRELATQIVPSLHQVIRSWTNPLSYRFFLQLKNNSLSNS